MWVAIELATLTTVVMVGIYRTHEALEAAWKYFILGSVGIALALFGTILVYMAAEPVIGGGPQRHGLDRPRGARRVASTRRCSISPSSSCCSATAPRSACSRCMPGCPTPMPKARRRSPRCCRACCSTSRSTRCSASRCCSAANPGRARARAADDRDGPGLAPVRRLHAVPAARHQAAVRLFLDRAHGHHHLRLRHGRPARQFRRAAAHGRCIR